MALQSKTCQISAKNYYFLVNPKIKIITIEVKTPKIAFKSLGKATPSPQMDSSHLVTDAHTILHGALQDAKPA